MMSKRVIDCEYPTPLLDEAAKAMARLLAQVPDGATITEMARLLGIPRGTVVTILRRPCDRHGKRFEVCGQTHDRKLIVGGKPAKLYRLIGANDQE